MNKRIYLSPPHMSGLEMEYIKEAFDSNWIAPLGPQVDAFEQEICSYVGATHGLALTSGTAAIHLILRYLGVGQGDYVFCSSLTFAGSCNPIMYQQATPVFIDAEPSSWNMSPRALEQAFHWAAEQCKLPKAVIIVDLYGQSADYEALLPICQHYGVPVIQDAAEALGATYQGKQCGSLGHFGVFSFNGNKIITTSGGGMVVSNDEVALRKMRYWATQAREPALHYEHVDYGYNYRLSNICAAIGRGQLAVLHERITARQQIFARYAAAFANTTLRLLPIMPYGQPNYWMTAVTIYPASEVTPRDIVLCLQEQNIEARPLWKPMNLQPVFSAYPFFPHHTDVGAELFAQGVCLPSGSNLTEDEQARVIAGVMAIVD